MDSPVKELEKLHALRDESRALFEAGNLEEALAKAETALEIEPQNQPILSLKAQILEKQGHGKKAENVRALVKQLKNDEWKRKVEAEARGQHGVMGQAVRTEKR